MALNCLNIECLKPLEQPAHKRYWCDEACWLETHEGSQAKIERSKERTRGPSFRRTIREPDDHPTVTMRNWVR